MSILFDNNYPGGDVRPEDPEVLRLRQRIRDLTAENEELRGRVFDVDLRDAIHALLKTEATAGELRRALGELLR